MLDLAAAIFFPRTCFACGTPLGDGVLCIPCRQTIAISRALFVRPGFPCTLGAATKYDCPAVKTLVHTLKFKGMRRAANGLASLLIEYVVSLRLDLTGFIVIPLPLSRERQRIRGFNQSELIAAHFARHFGLFLETHALARVRHTKPQSETTSVAERAENIRGCFGIADSYLVTGKQIILIDDVTTSGATLGVAARILLAAGAERVVALAVAAA